MKTRTALLAAAGLLAFTLGSAQALTVPVAEDTTITASGTSAEIHAASGTAGTLAVNAKSIALLQFDLNDPDFVPPEFVDANITSAILRLYVISAKPAGDLTIYSIVTPWTEHPAQATEAPPSIETANVVATIPAGDLGNRDFVSVDVTAAVVAAVNAGTFDGFAIVASGTTKVVLASKEGPANGSAGALDINADLAEDNSGNLTAQNIFLPATTATSGIIYSGGLTFIHDFGYSDFFAGQSAGNLSMTGSDNTSVGFETMLNNTTGYKNTGIGYLALPLNTSGYQNTAAGTGAMYTNGDGFQNTALGDDALHFNIHGYENTAVGFQSLYNDVDDFSNPDNGSDNVAVGYQALVNNTIGKYNTAVGYAALGNVTTSLNSIAIGYEAGINSNFAGNNIFIGNVGASGDADTIRIGTAKTHQFTFISGITGITVSGGAQVYVNSSGQLGTATSSRRFKRDIAPMGDASDVLFSLKPVTFRYKRELDPAGIPQFGLVAEDVNAVSPDLVVRGADGQIQTVRYEQVNAMLLNEFLKEHKRVEEQGRIIAAQGQANADQQKQIQALTARLEKMTQQIDNVAQRLDGKDYQPVVNHMASVPGE